MPASSRWTWQHRARVRASLVALILSPASTLAQNGNDDNSTEPRTETPIKHAIVLTGENGTFDHLSATYVPPGGENVRNLLSKRVINADGTPGPDCSKADGSSVTGGAF